MSTPKQMHAEHEAALSRLLSLSLSACERIEGRLAVAETDEEVASRTLSFTRAARAVRQTVALRERLFHEAERARRQAAEAARREEAEARAAALEAEDAAHEAEVSVRREVAREAIERVIWTEHEGDDERAEELVSDLDDLLRDDALAPEFVSQDLARYLAHLLRRLGLPALENSPAHPGESRGPCGVSEPAPVPGHGSAWIPACAGTSGAGEAEPAPEGDWTPPPAADSS